MSLHSILADVRDNWFRYASMPLVAAAIGYVTKIAAISMMFGPITFVGVRPYLGWQGIIPRNAQRMASIVCDTLTSKLLQPRELLERLDPVRVAEVVDRPLREAVEEVVREVFEHFSPGLWAVAPTTLRRRMVKRVQDKAPMLIEEILSKVRGDVGAVFDLTAC